MFEKGLLRRDDSQRTHVYTAEVREGKIQSALLDRFLNAAYKGSASKACPPTPRQSQNDPG